MHIVFVHTPMPTLKLDEMKDFWRGFDIQYHGSHPGLRHMKNVLWELPHWAHWLAGVLLENGFTSLSAIDFYSSGTPFEGIDRQKTHEVLTDRPADVYLFSPMTPNLPFALEIADVIKALYPKSVVIFGGVVASPLFQEIASYSSVDYVVYGRGEYALPALLKAIESNSDMSKVGNLAYRNAVGLVITSSFRYPDMPVDKIPFPKIDLFSKSTGEDIRYLRQVYALGCPYTCSFCTIQTIGRRPNYFPIARVLSEIRSYKAYYGNHHYIYWGDETFTLHEARMLELCNALETDGDIFYDCQTRLDHLSSKGIKALARSGCRWIEIGLETANQESQNLYKQRVKLSQTYNVLSQLRDEGIGACSFVVNGFPNQSVDDMTQSIEWFCNLIATDLLQATYFFNLVPYPGSAMFSSPEKFGMKIHHRNYKYYNEELLPVFDTPYATADEIFAVFKVGLVSLGQAMDKKPYFNDRPLPEHLDEYGAFWSKV